MVVEEYVLDKISRVNGKAVTFINEETMLHNNFQRPAFSLRHYSINT